MYTLRTITEKNVESNLYLGKHYKKYRYDHYLFKELADKLVLDDDHRSKLLYILLYDDSTEQVPIFNVNRNYIMTETGTTFEKLI